MAQMMELPTGAVRIRWRVGGSKVGGQRNATFTREKGPDGWRAFKAALEAQGHPEQPTGWVKQGRRWKQLTAAPEATGPTLASYGLETLQGKWLGGDDYYRLRSVARFKAHIQPTLGHIQVSELTPQHLSDWQLGLALAPKTITSLRTLLHTILDRAVIAGLLKASPLRSVKAIKGGKQGSSYAPTMETLAALELAVVQVDEQLPYPNDPTFTQDMWAVLFGTGLRMGEARAMRASWLKVTDAGAFLVVSNAVKRAVVDGKECGSWEGSTKTDAGQDRRIALGPATLAVIQRRILRAAPGGLLFPAAQGGLLAHSVWNTRMHRIVELCRAAGVELPADRISEAGRHRLALTAHGLRKAFSSWLQASGAPLAAASKALGHANVGITASTYTVDVGDEATQLAAAAALEALQAQARKQRLVAA